MTTELPLSLLPLRGTIKRYNKVTEEYDLVLADVPCRLSRHKFTENEQEYAKTSELELMIFFCNHTLEDGTPVDLRYQDQITIGTNIYKFIEVHDAASESHHIEGDVEHLKDLSTQV